jgi:CheY-like chemotaxis protein
MAEPSAGERRPGPGLDVHDPAAAAALAAAGREPRVSRAAAAHRRARPDGVRLAGVHVLVVEDQWDTRDLLAEILELRGCRVVAVGSAAEAIEAFDAAPPDVLVSDIGMPGEDGYSLVRESASAAQPRAERCRRIAISAYAREEGPDPLARRGIPDPHRQAVRAAEVLAAVGRMASRRGRPAEGERRIAPRRSDDATPDVLVIEDDADLREGLRD